jgi:hypothetical protein
MACSLYQMYEPHTAYTGQPIHIDQPIHDTYLFIRRDDGVLFYTEAYSAISNKSIKAAVRNQVKTGLSSVRHV